MVTFAPLFTVDVSHAYYDGPCSDVGFAIPSDTAQRLRNGRLIARTTGGRLYVLFEAAEAGEPLVAIAGQTLRVGLTLLNPSFPNFTADIVPRASALAVYRNTTSETALDAPIAADPAGQVLTHTLAESARPVSVSVQDPLGTLLPGETLAAGDARTSLAFDLVGRTPGLYTLSEAYPGGPLSTRYYFDTELLREQVFAIVEITVAASFYTSPAALQVAFGARADTLNYYLVARDHTTSEFDQLVVTDAGFADEGRSEITFTRINAAAFTPAELPPALLGNGEVKIALFRSAGPVPRRARGRQRIQLHRNSAVLVANLPQPASGRASADIIVHISKRP